MKVLLIISSSLALSRLERLTIQVERLKQDLLILRLERTELMLPEPTTEPASQILMDQEPMKHYLDLTEEILKSERYPDWRLLDPISLLPAKTYEETDQMDLMALETIRIPVPKTIRIRMNPMLKRMKWRWPPIKRGGLLMI